MPSDNGVVEAHRSSLLERVVFSKTTNVSEKEHGTSSKLSQIGGFPKIPKNGWFIMENPIEVGDFGVTPILGNPQIPSETATVITVPCRRSSAHPPRPATTSSRPGGKKRCRSTMQ